MPVTILFFIDIICFLLVVVSVPIFFVREMRFAASRLLLAGLGGYVGSALGYLAVVLASEFNSSKLLMSSTVASEVLVVTIACGAILVGLGVGIRVGYALANRLNRQRGWD